MKNLIFKGDLVTADFEEKTMTFEIENDMVVQAGNYTIVKTDDYEKLVNGVDSERKALHIDGVSVSLPSDEQIEELATKWCDEVAECWNAQYSAFIEGAQQIIAMITSNER